MTKFHNNNVRGNMKASMSCSAKWAKLVNARRTIVQVACSLTFSTGKSRNATLQRVGNCLGFFFFFCVWGFFLDSGLDTFCMLFPAFRSWKLLRPNVFTAFWSSMLSFSVLFATFWTFCMLLPAFWSWKWNCYDRSPAHEQNEESSGKKEREEEGK